MIRGSFTDTHPFGKILLSAIIILSCFLLFSLIGTIAAVIVFDIDLFRLSQVTNNLSDPVSIRLLKFLQVVQSMGLFIVPPFLIGFFLHSGTREFLSLGRTPLLTGLLLSAAVMISAVPMINFLGKLNSGIHLPDLLQGVEDWMRRMEEQAESITDSFLQFRAPGDLWINLFVIAVLPGIGEELLFRGVIQRLFSEWTRSVHWGILITAVLFSMSHVQFFGFIPRLLMGVLFGYMLVWSGSLWYPVIAHFTNNALAVVYYYLAAEGRVGRELEEVGATPDKFYLVAVSLIMSGLLLYVLYKRESEKNSSPAS